MDERPLKKGACSSLCALKRASLTLLDNEEGNLISGAENLVSPECICLRFNLPCPVRIR